MIKKNKNKVIISSIITLLPALFGIVFWNKLPDTMMSHWGMDGNADGFSNKAFAVFGLPIILLALHWICLIVTSFDKKQKNQSKKALEMIFWIVPFLSMFINEIMYSISFGNNFNPLTFMPLMLGIMFAVIGNYLPKVTQNHTLGIRISWTLNNEENWNRTHRFAGKIWVIGGLILAFSVFLPSKLITPVAAAAIAVLVIAPIVYSYHIYKNHLKSGISYKAAQKSKNEKIFLIINTIFLAIILVGVTVFMFTGNIKYQCTDNSLKIEADYWSDLEINYDNIESIEYRESFDSSIRTNGLGTARLAIGNFRNDEFGDYTRYSYAQNNSCIVLKVNGNILVINGKNAEKTKEIYELILTKSAK